MKIEERNRFYLQVLYKEKEMGNIKKKGTFFMLKLAGRYQR